jgi:hypothetical protein
MAGKSAPARVASSITRIAASATCSRQGRATTCTPIGNSRATLLDSIGRLLHQIARWLTADFLAGAHARDGNDADQQMCVLWGFENGKVASGRHLIGGQDALDAFYAAVLS